METKARYALIGLFVSGAIAAAFAFVYWLHTTGGLGQRAVYQIRFENSVSGLLIGSNVLFNGVRVGEVTGLALDPKVPQQVLATIGVDPSTPIRTDTHVDLDFQGLTGAPVILLTGGSPSAPATSGSGGHPPVLSAGPAAGQSLNQSARETLARIDKILADNADPLHQAITGISTFAQALARNSDRVDGILAGLERMTGGASASGRVPIYTLSALSDVGPCPHPPHGSIAVSEPESLVAFNTNKLLVVGAPHADLNLDQAQWADNIPALIQAKVIESLDSTGCFKSVTGPFGELDFDYKLALSIRDFSIAPSPEPTANIIVAASLIKGIEGIAATRVFTATEPLKAVNPAGAVAASDTAFGKILRDLVPWVEQNTAASVHQGAEPPSVRNEEPGSERPNAAEPARPHKRTAPHR